MKTTFEVGGVTARVNASAYYGLYEDVKVTTTVTATNPATGVTSAQAVQQNAGEGVIKGLDIEVTVLPTTWLEIGGYYALTDTEYTKFPSVLQVSNNPPTFVPIDLSSTAFSFVSRIEWGLQAAVKLPVDLDRGELRLSANYTRHGSQIGGSKPVVPTDPNNVDATGLLCQHVRTTANGYGPLSADGKAVPLDCRKPIPTSTYPWTGATSGDGKGFARRSS